MAHKCQISGKGGQFGHRVSHAKNKTKHLFLANLQTKKIWIPEKKKWVRLKISTSMIRTIDKIGLEGALRKYNLSLSDIAA